MRNPLWDEACKVGSVSYTHLDVYKRQHHGRPPPATDGQHQTISREVPFVIFIVNELINTKSIIKKNVRV